MANERGITQHQPVGVAVSYSCSLPHPSPVSLAIASLTARAIACALVQTEASPICRATFGLYLRLGV